MGYRANERGKLSGISLPQAMGSWPLAQSLFYQYNRTIERAGRLRGKRSAQTAATPNRPSSLITNAARFAPNRSTSAQPREEILGLPPAPRRLAAARPPQPRESGPARHPNPGPGAVGGGGWPMHATAQPGHAQGRPSPTGAMRCLLSPRERRGTPPAARPGGCHGSSPGPPWQHAPCQDAPCAPAPRWPAPAPSHRS